MKDMPLNIVKEALGLFSKRQADYIRATKEKNKLIHVEAWEEYNMDMINFQEKVKFVRFVETIQTISQVKVVKQETKEILLVTTCKEEVKLESLKKMIHKRWDNESCLFHQLKTHGIWITVS